MNPRSPFLFISLMLLATHALSQNLLTNPGLEGSTDRAVGWNDIIWGTTNPVRSYSRETLDVHGGLSAQKITVTSMGSSDAGYVFKQGVTFGVGKIYEGTVYLRSDDSIEVQVYCRRSGPWYEPCATRTLEVGSTWQAVTIRGGFGDAADVAGFLGINFLTTGTLVIDDASLTEIPRGALRNAGTLIPATLFGMHMNHYGAFTDGNWPAVNFGMLRLWDCGTRWNELETAKGVWVWGLMDNLVTNAYGHGQDVIYAMGQTPTWASARPAESGVYGPGAAAEPADIQDWRDYVRTVATRYQGKIKYYEIWNEWDQGIMCSMTMAKMMELIQAAREELLAVDPAIKVLSPNVTRSGFGKLDKFLFQGGGQYIDIISFHEYPPATPELGHGFMVCVQNLAENYGISDKPIWNTEGSGTGGTDAQARGYVCRSFLTQWMDGIVNFNWYCWDIHHPLSLAPEYTTWNASGYAYHETVNWLKGSVVTARNIDTNGTWDVSLVLANGKEAHVLWNESQTPFFSVPAEWNIAFTRDLQGNSSTGAVSSLMLGPEPVLLESSRSTATGATYIASFEKNPDSDSMSLSWVSAVGRTYAVQTSTNLFEAWTDVHDSSYTNVQGSGATVVYTNMTTDQKRFFRIRVW